MISTEVPVVLVAAMALNRVIGYRRTIPWKIPGDQVLFRRLTEGKVLVMGRKTIEAIGNPLPNRTNVVLTRQIGYSFPGSIVVNSFEEAIEVAKSFGSELMVGGGAEVYSLALPSARRIHLTIVQSEFPGDTFFPEFSHAEFVQKSAESFPGSIPYLYVVYERG